MGVIMTPKQQAHQWASDLATIAKSKRITRKRIAELSGIHAMTITHVLNGNQVANSETLAAIAEVLGVRLEWVDKECKTHCGMNHCDENGCTNRKRFLTEPIDLTTTASFTTSNQPSKGVNFTVKGYEY